jgi:hypothetical protein
VAGEVWLFDPAGGEKLPNGVRRLRWSPVTAAGTWDDALIMARAMTAATKAGKGTTNENHWSERAAALLAPLLYAAHLTDEPIEEVLRWTLRQDMSTALQALAEQNKNRVATDVLIGIERTDARERSSIFSATAGVLAAYNADATSASAKNPNFDPKKFAQGTVTIYITAPEHKQALCAPLIVGLLSRSATPSTTRHTATTRASGCCGRWNIVRLRSRCSSAHAPAPRDSTSHTRVSNGSLSKNASSAANAIRTPSCQVSSPLNASPTSTIARSSPRSKTAARHSSRPANSFSNVWREIRARAITSPTDVLAKPRSATTSTIACRIRARRSSIASPRATPDPPSGSAVYAMC